MLKRTSPRASLSPRSSAVDYDDDSAAEALNPSSKRLKAANGVAVVSPGRPGVHEDDEMHDEIKVQQPTSPPHANNKKGTTVRRRSRSFIRANMEAARKASRDAQFLDESTAEPDGEAVIDDDVGEATVLHTNGNHITNTSTSTGDRKVAVRAGSNSNGVHLAGSNAHAHAHAHAIDELSDVSEDTDGDVPMPKRHSPSSTYHHLAVEEINNNEPQVTCCVWYGCRTGDLGTMDKLVEHLHAEHVEGKQRRYTCEWQGCARKGKSHASAYALKAHLRSHTREKPHVCLLPECDQAFARQDALNKHMRSAHEIDLMRSFDPSTRGGSKAGGSAAAAASVVNGTGLTNGSGSGANGHAAAAAAAAATTTTNGTKSKFKIIIKTPMSHATGFDESVDPSAVSSDDPGGSDLTVLSNDLGFSAHEMDMPARKLYGLCCSQLRWAEEENEELLKECAAWEEIYNRAWLEQQVLLDQVIANERSWYERRKVVLQSLAVEEEKRAAVKAAQRAEEIAARGGGDDVKDEDDSAGEGEGEDDGEGEGDGDNDGDGDDDGDDDDDDDDDLHNMTLDADATQDYSFADATSFSVVGGSSLRNEVTVNGD